MITFMSLFTHLWNILSTVQDHCENKVRQCVCVCYINCSAQCIWQGSRNKGFQPILQHTYTKVLRSIRKKEIQPHVPNSHLWGGKKELLNGEYSKMSLSSKDMFSHLLTYASSSKDLQALCHRINYKVFF